MSTILQKACVALQEGDVIAALEAVEVHLAEDKEDGHAWEMLGLIQYQRDQFSESVSALEMAALLVPLKPMSRICIAYGYSQLGRVELARDLLCELIDDETLSTYLLLQVATGLDSIGEPSLAMHACRVSLERDPESAQSYYDLGFYASECGYPAKYTESLARKAITLEPENVCYRVGISSLLAQQKRHEEAFGFVSELTLEQIESITCRCCILKVMALYKRHNDTQRAEICYQQYQKLELFDRNNPC